jgi:hypothetical protein
VDYGSELDVRMKFAVDRQVDEPSVYVTFINQSLQAEINLNSHYDGHSIKNETGELDVTLVIREVALNPGIHYLSVGVQTFQPFKILKQYYAYRKLIVRGSFVGIAPVQMRGLWHAAS